MTDDDSANSVTSPNMMVASKNFDTESNEKEMIYKFLVRMNDVNSLKEYVGNYDDLSYSIPENVSGYLLYKNALWS